MYTKLKTSATETIKDLHKQALSEKYLKKSARILEPISDEQRDELLTMTGSPA